MASPSVILHPLVLLSIQDHAARAAKGTKKRVIGILLGSESAALGGGRTLNVVNSFAVPFEEDDKDSRTWFLDHDYIDAMNDMFKKVNTREKLVGWYHTGPKLRASDLEINDVIKRFTPKPVMVIVDVRPDHERSQGGIPTDAYCATEEIRDDGSATQQTFTHIPSAIEASEAEEIGVEHLLRDISTLSVGTLSTRVASQLSSLTGLQARLLEIKDYLTSVVEGELPVNHQVIYNLQDVFNLLPNLEATELGGVGSSGVKRPFTTATNDGLLVVYLSSLIRTVIALHDLVLNKQSAHLLEEPEAEVVLSKEDEEAKAKKDKEESKSGAEKAKDWFAEEEEKKKGDQKGGDDGEKKGF